MRVRLRIATVSYDSFPYTEEAGMQNGKERETPRFNESLTKVEESGEMYECRPFVRKS